MKSFARRIEDGDLKPLGGKVLEETGAPLIATAISSTPQLELRCPREPEYGSEQDWLAEVREMRGQVWYDQGHRPSFRMADGRFEDSDAVDAYAYHIVARADERVVGCVRVAPMAQIQSGVVSTFIGEERLANIVRDIGASRERTCEASRWAVLPEFRGELGSRLAVASWAVARWLSMDTAFVVAGTRQKQDLALIRMGARPVEGVPLLSSRIFEDELRLLFFDVPRPSDSMQRRIDEAAAALHLTTPAVASMTA